MLTDVKDRKREQLQTEIKTTIPSFEEAARQVYEDISMSAVQTPKHERPQLPRSSIDIQDRLLIAEANSLL